MRQIFFTMCLVSVFICFVWGLARIVGDRYSRKWKYVIWIILGIRLLFPYDISLTQYDMSLSVSGVVKEKTERIMGSTGEIPELIGKREVSGEEKQGVDNQKVDSPGDYITRENKIHFVSENDIRVFKIRKMFWPGIALIWGVGAAFIFLITCFRYRSYRKGLLRFCRREANEKEIREAEKIGKRLGLHKLPKLYRCIRLSSPMVIGTFSPILLLPEKTYHGQELELLLTHEFTHIKRKDLWVKSVMVFIRCMYWFNPFIYLMERELSRDIEFLCDEKVVAERDETERREYNRLILESAVGKQTRLSVFSTSISGQMKNLKERFVMNMEIKAKKAGYRLTAVVVVFILCMTVFVSCGEPEKTPTATSSNRDRIGEKTYREKKIDVMDLIAEGNSSEKEVMIGAAEITYAGQIAVTKYERKDNGSIRAGYYLWNGDKFEFHDNIWQKALEKDKIVIYDEEIFGADNKLYGIYTSEETVKRMDKYYDSIQKKREVTGDDMAAFYKREENYRRLCRLNEDGSITKLKISAFQIGDVFIEGGYDMQILEDGTIFARGNPTPDETVDPVMLHADMNGKVLKKYEGLDDVAGIKVIGDTIYGARKGKIVMVSLVTGEVLSEIKLEDTTRGVRFCKDEEENVYYICSSGIFRIADNLRDTEKVFDGNNFMVSAITEEYMIINFGCYNGKFYSVIENDDDEYVYEYSISD